MLNHVLLPLDGTTESEGALKLARRFLAHAESGSLTLLRVVEETRGSHRETAMAEANHELRELSDRLKVMRHVHVATRVVAGDPAEVITDVAAQVKPDFVAMATHGRTGFDRLINGSVTEAVLRLSDSPLLVGNTHGLSLAAGDALFHKLLVPLDGSTTAGEILPLATKVALHCKAEVILQRVTAKEDDEAAGYVQQLAQSMGERGVGQVSVLMQQGDPAESILASVEEYRCDLVVMSSHGRTGMARLRFGSVTENVMRNCPAPLLVKRSQLES